jgi:hypothetical protein
MGGQGPFTDNRGAVNLTIIQSPDLVALKLPALLAYQLSLQTPAPPAGSFNGVAARRGAEVFNGACARCHIPPIYTDVRSGPDADIPVLHSAVEVGVEPEYATRSAGVQDDAIASALAASAVLP